VVVWESSYAELTFEQTNLNVFIQAWLPKENSIKGVYRSKRFVQYTTILENCVDWCSNVASNKSITNYGVEEIIVLAEFPETF